MKNKKTKRVWNAPLICFFTFFLVILVLFAQFCYLSLSKNVYGINMKSFAKTRNTISTTLTAKRGTIYDIEGNVLAQNITSYTLIAYLDPSRTIDENDPKHVVDKEYTAVKLSSILGEDYYGYILERLNKTSKQVEFGKIGKNLTELTKIAIQQLDLPGIDFVETVNRYYPNGDFASYIVGYAKQYTRINIKAGTTYDLYQNYRNFFENYSNVKVETLDHKVVSIEGSKITGITEGSTIITIKTNNDILANIVLNVTEHDNYNVIDSTIVGELGIESKYDDKLTGTDGYIQYQQDKYGYKIPDTPEIRLDDVDGYDIYLTIDSNVQRFAENAINEIMEDYNPKWSIVSVMDAKTGDILASATSPSYNPNNLPSDMSYQNPLVSYTYEPGSVMKIYTYMCALETGLYDGNKKYLSGSYKFDDGTVVHDWNNYGWGYLTYDVGFSYSSNVGIINIVKDYLSSEKLRTCLQKYGFGKKTGVELSNEEAGSIKFKYETEVMAAGYGQGISTTPIQHLQALTMIANDGVMLKPHIIKKMVNTDTKDEIVTEVEKSEKLVSSKTINKMKDLMESVIQEGSATGSRYYIKDYGLIGKTGTAQIYENGKYLTGDTNYIVSIGLMYPKDDPEIIIYAAAKQPTHSIGYVLPETMVELVKNISKYKGMFNTNEAVKKNNSYVLPTFISEDVISAKSTLEKNNMNPIVIGDGKKVIKQYPEKGTKTIYGDKVFLLTNGTNYKMENLTNWSRYDVVKLCELIGIEYSFEGSGYVVSQSIEKNKVINKGDKLDILLGNIK